MTKLDELCITLGKLLTRQAKSRLRQSLNTHKLCNLPFRCDKEATLSKLAEYQEVLRHRIEYQISIGQDSSADEVELVDIGKAVELVEAYEP